jgi:hypothetical protein
MKKWFVLALLALTTSGCAVRTSSGTTVRFFARGLPLQITHTCTERAEVRQAGKGLIGEIVGPVPQDFYLDPVSFDSAVSVTVQSLDDKGRVVGTYHQSFDLQNRYRLVQAWFITRENVQGGGEARVIQCHR